MDPHRPCARPWIRAAHARSALGGQPPAPVLTSHCTALIEVEGGREKGLAEGEGGRKPDEEDGGSVGWRHRWREKWEREGGERSVCKENPKFCIYSSPIR